MNAHTLTDATTATDCAPEWVWCGSSYGPRDNPTRHVILTTADRRYLVANDRQYALLKAGMSPDDLDLTEIDGDDDE